MFVGKNVPAPVQRKTALRWDIFRELRCSCVFSPGSAAHQAVQLRCGFWAGSAAALRCVVTSHGHRKVQRQRTATRALLPARAARCGGGAAARCGAAGPLAIDADEAPAPTPADSSGGAATAAVAAAAGGILRRAERNASLGMINGSHLSVDRLDDARSCRSQRAHHGYGGV